jgi:transposase InsO family protein
MKSIKYLKIMAYEQYRQALKRLSLIFDKYQGWRKTANTLKLSKEACQRLEWFIFYYSKAGKNAKLTCRHFNIARSVLYYWRARFDETNLRTLENQTTAPRNTRKRRIDSLQEQKAIKLRREHMHWGKMKLAKVYEDIYKQKLSSWQFQNVIRIYRLYPNPKKNAKIQAKRRRSAKKKRITELKIKLPLLGYLLHFDTIEIYWNGMRRYIFTMIDDFTKIAFARMYTTKSSKSAADFLLRVLYLLDGNVKISHQDNGSEFEKLFKELCLKWGIRMYHSRPRTPKDNPALERFNQSLKYEWLNDGNFTFDVADFNSRLANFIVEYNYVRPHQTLNYLTPINFAVKYKQLSKMSPSSTRA